MIGCLMLVPIAGFFIAMGVYMSSLMAFFVGIVGLMGMYMSGVAAYFTAFFMFVLG